MLNTYTLSHDDKHTCRHWKKPTLQIPFLFLLQFITFAAVSNTIHNHFNNGKRSFCVMRRKFTNFCHSWMSPRPMAQMGMHLRTHQWIRLKLLTKFRERNATHIRHLYQKHHMQKITCKFIICSASMATMASMCGSLHGVHYTVNRK